MEKKESGILIDTDVMINYFDDHRKYHAEIKSAFNQFEVENVETYISLVSFIEVLQGSKSMLEKNRILKKLIQTDFNLKDSGKLSSLTWWKLFLWKSKNRL